MPRRRFLIIHNVHAGTARRGLFHNVLRELERRGCEVTTQIADDIEADRRLAAEAAASGNYDAVVAAGGDSTIRGVALGLFGTGVPLGVLPVGTGNVMAAEIGLRHRTGDIVDTLTDGPVRKVQGATANGEPFLLMAGAGYDGAVVADLNFSLKRLVGRAAYSWPILYRLLQRFPKLRVDVDGERHDARWAVVTNARHYAGAFSIDKDSSIFDDGLTTILFQPRSRLELAAQLVRLAIGRLAQAPGVTFLPSRRTRIEADECVPVQIEGESFGATPLTVSADDRTISLLAPR